MNGDLRQLREMFAAQFERDGEGYLFRQDQKGPAYPLTAAEHARFLARFGREMLVTVVATVVVTLLLVGAVAYLVVLKDSEPPEAMIYVAVFVMIGMSLAGAYWVWRAPSRALRGRTPLRQALSNEDFQRKHLAKLSYGQLALGGLFGLAMPFFAGGFDVLEGWGRLWLLFGGLVALVCAVQAFRKWRFEREPRSNR